MVNGFASVPAVAVTVTVLDPAGVPGSDVGVLLLLPPQAIAMEQKPTAQIKASRRSRRWAGLRMPEKTNPRKPGHSKA